MFGQCPIFAHLGLRSILMLCEQAKMGEYGVLAEYLPFFLFLLFYLPKNLLGGCFHLSIRKQTNTFF